MEDNSKRQLTITKTMNAPVTLVWEVFTKPEHIKKWWGPNRFTNTISVMDFKVGGTWEFIMQGPDGTDYRNIHRYKEIVPFERIVMEHVTAPKFTTTIQFTAAGDKTIIDWTGLFESAEQLQHVIKVFKADEGMKQNMERLMTYLNNL